MLLDRGFAYLGGIPFLDLGNGWALSADRNQWILNKAKKHQRKVKWQPKAFVGSNTAVLVRVMREKGLRVPPDTSVAVNRFFATDPQKFLHWRDQVAREWPEQWLDNRQPA